IERGVILFQEQLALARQIGYMQGECDALGNLGRAHVELGQREQGMTFFSESNAIARKIGNRDSETTSSWNQGNLLARLGHLDEAIPLMEKRVSYLGEIGHSQANQLADYINELRRNQDSKMSLTT